MLFAKYFKAKASVAVNQEAKIHFMVFENLNLSEVDILRKGLTFFLCGFILSNPTLSRFLFLNDIKYFILLENMTILNDSDKS